MIQLRLFDYTSDAFWLFNCESHAIFSKAWSNFTSGCTSCCLWSNTYLCALLMFYQVRTLSLVLLWSLSLRRWVLSAIKSGVYTAGRHLLFAQSLQLAASSGNISWNKLVESSVKHLTILFGNLSFLLHPLLQLVQFSPDIEKKNIESKALK